MKKKHVILFCTVVIIAAIGISSDLNRNVSRETGFPIYNTVSLPEVQESLCGPPNFQPVEQYDGTLGPSIDFINRRQAAVGNLHWKFNLGSGNVSGKRWGTGTLKSHNLFLTAGHCFDNPAAFSNWVWPDTVLSGSTDRERALLAALNMTVRFNYQDDSLGMRRTEIIYDIVDLVEWREDGLDYAILKLEGNPGYIYGYTPVLAKDLTLNEMLTIIQHPDGRPKEIEAGLFDGDIGSYITYRDLDTEGGSSGSGVLDANRFIVGVHVEGGCTSVGGANTGVSMEAIAGSSDIIPDLMARNLALHQPATQSSTYGSTPVAARAVDGNTDGIFSHNSVTHTYYDNQAWWQVNLQSTKIIHGIKIWNRTDCCSDRLVNYRVLVLDRNSNVVWSNEQDGYPDPVVSLNLNSVIGRYVKIELTGTNYLSLAEVEVLGTDFINLAMGKTAIQSSTYSSAAAARAVDGNTDGVYSHNSVSHTLNNSQAWWRVDLGAELYIDYVRLFNRTDCCGDRLDSFYVSILDSSLNVVTSRYISTPPNPSTTIALSGVKGRYVKVQLTGTDYLSLAEVQVVGGPLPNLALNKTATQSTTYGAGVASRAVDGNTDGNYFHGSVTHTQNQRAWWQVDLGKDCSIAHINVWNRTFCCTDRLSGYYIYVYDSSSTLVWSGRFIYAPAAYSKVYLGSVTGRYVLVQLENENYLHMAEVEVFGL